MKKFTFEGNEYEYNPDAFKNYAVLKKLANAEKDISGAFYAFNAIFAGKDEEYAEMLGGDIEKLGELVSAAAEHHGGEVKN